MHQHISTKKGIAYICLTAFLTASVILAVGWDINTSVTSQFAPTITKFTIEDGYFVVLVEDVNSVEVWEVTTSSSTRNQKVFVGELEQQEKLWKLEIPVEAKEVYTYEARAYNKEGQVVDVLALPFSGADEVFTHVWGPSEDNVITLSPGATMRYNDLTLTLHSVVTDTRCPAEVQCIYAGEFVYSLTTRTPRKTQKDRFSFDEDIIFDRYRIRVKEISPSRSIETQSINSLEYKVTFEILMTLDSVAK